VNALEEIQAEYVFCWKLQCMYTVLVVRIEQSVQCCFCYCFWCYTVTQKPGRSSLSVKKVPNIAQVSVATFSTNNDWWRCCRDLFLKQKLNLFLKSV